ncbi:hypothetical protein [Vibrio metschnikovii]|uniref:hypothetical protein n=1 Tax=Vibrio metschnikovii TaxID=28172 RepID=UPI001C2FFB42|nr:hypothetical protein [Vibrio metschnikovii]
MIKFNFVSDGKVNVHGIIFVGLMVGSALYYNSLLLPWMFHSMEVSHYLLYPLMFYACFFLASPLLSGIFMTWFTYNYLDFGILQAGVLFFMQIGIFGYAMINPISVRCFTIVGLSALSGSGR